MCELCGEKTATVIWPINGVGTVVHVCEDCDAEVVRKS